MKLSLFYLLAFTITVTFLSCGKKEPKYGALSGNIFWKYNNYVGNKPDAGSDVDLYSLEDKDVTFSTKADVRGDWEFTNVPVGRYLIIIKSKNTTSRAKDNLRELYYSARDLETLSDASLNFLEAEYRKVAVFDSLAGEALRSDSKNNIDRYDSFNDSADEVSSKIFDRLPTQFQIKVFIVGKFSNSLEIKSVSVNEGPGEKIVTDFGITYM